MFFQALKHRQTHRDVWGIAAPMILSNLSVPLLGMVDTAVVGHLDSPHYIGAVAVGSMIFGIVFWGFGFLRMGTTAFTAQAFGANDGNEIRAIALRALFLALLFSIVLLVLQGPLAWLAFELVGASEAVEQEAVLYFQIRIMSAPATLVNYVLLGWFIGLQNARLALLLLLFVNTVNAILDILFVVGWGMGADGVAWASLVAEYSSVCLGLLLVRRELKNHPGLWLRAQIVDRAKLLRMVSVNRDIFIRTLCLMFTLAFFTAQGSRMGDGILAANAVLFTFQTFMAYGLDGLAHAAEALSGRAAGAGDRKLFRRSLQVVFFWAFLLSIAFAVLYAMMGEFIIALISDQQMVRAAAVEYLPWMLILPLVSIWSFIFDGVFIGTTRAGLMRNTMLFSTFVVFLPLWYLLQDYQNHGLWLAFTAFMLARAMSMAAVYFYLSRQNRFIHFGAAD